MSDCCSNSSAFNKSTKPVPIKDMICYCFHHTKQNIIDDVVEHGTSHIEMDVRQKVKEKLCTCEVSNPKGKCCLGDMRKVIKGVEQHG